MALRSRQDIEYCEKCEEQGLLGFAKHMCEAERLGEEERHKYRSDFARDRDRIIYSDAFRRLVYKTQMFMDADPSKLTTRLAHTIKVSQIAQTIARALRLNEDLAVAIALGHDVGHAPFGHLGEDVIREQMMDFNGFEHNEESVFVILFFESLNLTVETMEGILKHTKFSYEPYKNRDIEREDPFGKITHHDCDVDLFEKFNYFGHEVCGKIEFKQPASLEGQVVDVADEIAYIAHDLFDLKESGILDESDFPSWWRRQFGTKKLVKNTVNRMVTGVIDSTIKKLEEGADPRREIITHPVAYADKIAKMKIWYVDVFQRKQPSQVALGRKKIEKVFELFEQYPDEMKKWCNIYYERISDYGYEGKELSGHCIATLTDREINGIYDCITKR